MTDSRNVEETNAVRRRRECLQCSKRFTTFEMVELNIRVEKRDGRQEAFDERKLIRGLELACSHTKMGREELLEVVAKVVLALASRGSQVVSSRELGEMLTNYLKKLDPVAYIRFACVQCRFTDIDEVQEAIQSITQ